MKKQSYALSEQILLGKEWMSKEGISNFAKGLACLLFFHPPYMDNGVCALLSKVSAHPPPHRPTEAVMLATRTHFCSSRSKTNSHFRLNNAWRKAAAQKIQAIDLPASSAVLDALAAIASLSPFGDVMEITRKKLAKLTGKSKDTIYRHLSRAKKAGIFEVTRGFRCLRIRLLLTNLPKGYTASKRNPEGCDSSSDSVRGNKDEASSTALPAADLEKQEPARVAELEQDEDLDGLLGEALEPVTKHDRALAAKLRANEMEAKGQLRRSKRALQSYLFNKMSDAEVRTHLENHAVEEKRQAEEKGRQVEEAKRQEEERQAGEKRQAEEAKLLRIYEEELEDDERQAIDENADSTLSEVFRKLSPESKKTNRQYRAEWRKAVLKALRRHRREREQSDEISKSSSPPLGEEGKSFLKSLEGKSASPRERKIVNSEANSQGPPAPDSLAEKELMDLYEGELDSKTQLAITSAAFEELSEDLRAILPWERTRNELYRYRYRAALIKVLKRFFKKRE